MILAGELGKCKVVNCRYDAANGEMTLPSFEMTLASSNIKSPTAAKKLPQLRLYAAVALVIVGVDCCADGTVLGFGVLLLDQWRPLSEVGLPLLLRSLSP